MEVRNCPGLDEFVTVLLVNVSKDVIYPIETVNLPEYREQQFRALLEEHLSEEGKWLDSAQSIFSQEDNIKIDQVS